MIWLSALAFGCQVALADTPLPTFELDGQEVAVDALPAPLRSKLEASPNLGLVSTFDTPIYKFTRECKPPGSKNCVFRYDLPPTASGNERVCDGQRGTLAQFLECLEKTAAIYERQTQLSESKVRSFVERFNTIAPADQRLEWSRDVEPELAMSDGGWAKREKIFAQNLAQKISNACTSVAEPPTKENCAELSAGANLAVLEHATKGLAYEQVFNMENTLWSGNDLPENLKIMVEPDGAPTSTQKRLPPKGPLGGFRIKPKNKAGTEAADLGALGVCAQFYPTFNATQDQDPCIPLTQESLAFQKDIERVMGFASILTYFDILRLEAITASLKAYRDLFGPMPSLPAQCSAFNPNLANANRAPVSPETPGFYQSREYYDLLKRAAVDADALSREAAAKALVPEWIADQNTALPDGASMTTNPAYPPAQRRITEIESELAELFGKFPLLKGFHESGKPLYQGNVLGPLMGADTRNQAAMAALLREPRQQLKRELAHDLGRFCDEKATPWDALVRDSGITKSVIEKYPRFNPFQLCAADIAEKEKIPGDMLLATVGLACTAAVAGPQAVVGGPVCGILGLALAGNEFLDGLEHLSRTEECRAAGDALCSAEDYLQARREYESAVDGLTAAGLLSVGDVAITVAAFKNLARTLKARELAELTAKLKRVVNFEGEALARQLRDIAELPEGSRAPALARALDEALTSGRAELIQELAKGSEASENALVAFFSEHYGLPVDDADVKLLARAAKAYVAEGGSDAAAETSDLLDSLLSACRAGKR